MKTKIYKIRTASVFCMRKKMMLSIMVMAITLSSFAQIGIGTTTPDASAVLDITSTTKGLLPPRMTVAQMKSINIPEAGLMVYCTDCAPVGMYLFNGSDYVNLTTYTPTPILISPTGKIWMDRNLGATQVATSINDYLSYGDLYQWGRAADGHQTIVWQSSTLTNGAEQSNETTTQATTGTANDGRFIISSPWTTYADVATLWQDGLNDPCPTGFSVPTKAELTAELAAFPSNDVVGAFAALKLPTSGSRSSYHGTVLNWGDVITLWSKTLEDSSSATILHVGILGGTLSTNAIANGLSIRCIKD